MEDLSAAETEIDRELQQALAGEPSPGFVARVRERVAGETSPSTAWWRWGLAPAAAAALVLAIVVLRSGPDERRGTASGTQVPLTARAVAPPSEIVALLPATAPPRPTVATLSTALAASAPPTPRAAPRVRPAAGEPVVVISRGETAALRRLIANVTSGRFDPASLPAPRESAERIEKPVGIMVQPIAIDRIEVRTIQTAGDFLPGNVPGDLQ